MSSVLKKADKLNLSLSLYPTSLANLVVEVGTRHSHQILFEMPQLKTCNIYFLYVLSMLFIFLFSALPICLVL